MGLQNTPIGQTLRQMLEAEEVDVDSLDQGSSHPYNCICEMCWKWWRTMGLGEEPHPPFVQAELDAPTYEIAMQIRGIDALGPLDVTELLLQFKRAREADNAE